MLLLVLLTFQPIELPFSCKLETLGRTLPRLKQTVSESTYDKLDAIHTRSLKQREEKEASRRPRFAMPLRTLGIDDGRNDVAVANEIRESLSGTPDKQLCLSLLSMEFGYLSVTDPNIMGFANVDAETHSRLRELNRELLKEMKKEVRKAILPSKSYDSVAITNLVQSLYLQVRFSLKQKLTEKQYQQIEFLYTGYDHEDAVKRLAGRLIRARENALDVSHPYYQYHPSVLGSALGDGCLVLIDQKLARTYLGMSNEQEKQALSLLKQFRAEVAWLQESLSDTIYDDSIEQIRLHERMASQLGQKYSQVFSRLLSKEQQLKQVQLTTQVRGYTMCFSPPLCEKLGISEQERTEILKFLSDKMRVMPVQAADDAERQYQVAVYASGVIRDEKLNDEQRKQWKQFIGTEIPPADIEVLQRSYCKCQVHSVKAPPKVEQP